MWEALRFFDQPDPAPTLPFADETVHPVLSSPGGRGRERGNLEKRPYSRELMLKHELETFGFFLSLHPLDRYRDRLKHVHYVRARDLHRWVGKAVTTIGWQITGKTVQTVKGDTMKFVSFEDQTGIYETVFFPKAYHRFCHMLNAERPYMLKGRVAEEFGAVTMTVHWLGFLDNPKKRISKSI